MSDPARSVTAMNASIGWVIVILVLAGLGYVGYLVGPQINRQRAIAARRRDEIRERADRQHHWALRGDARGLYGADGAALMRHVSEQPQLDEIAAEPGEPPKVAAVAYTAEDLATLIAERPACWRYAVFASVLVQRRTSLTERLRDQQLGYARIRGARIHSGFKLAQYLTDLLDQLSALVGRMEELMLSSGFTRMFGDPVDEDSADADAIVHAANRLMDLHERILNLAERCRGVEVLSEHAGVVRDCARVFDAPLDGYRNFIDEFVERVGEMPEVMCYARGHIELEPIMLHVSDDDRLFDKAFKGLRKLASAAN
ncbi:hypothetical protein ABW16_19835 [Mycolicibacter heraklionensis]|uniref:Uncharacterized protein n=2 Tax=Mycolicibacter heraklionensis TaxID=512402 RepID=A0ABR5FAZ8_9MYCO|nr:hypothetical protein ABW16_19835 [Mycolicibacter heraklionensis]